jgi:hypothetical protein
VSSVPDCDAGLRLTNETITEAGHMAITLKDWLVLLRGFDLIVSVPLIIGGMALMIFGWRLWKTTVVLCFGTIGVLIGQAVGGKGLNNIIYMLLGAAALGALSYRFARYAVTLLGGLIGTVVVLQCLVDLHLSDSTYWVAAAASFVAFSALAHINRKMVVVFVGAFVGAMLAISGLGICLVISPSMNSHFHAMVLDSGFVLAFALVVPTTMSCFYPSAEVNRLQIEL